MSHFPHLVLCREEQVLSDDSFADRLLHGGGVEASVGERKAALEALRWPPLGLYVQLAFAPEHEREATLSHFPLSDDGLLDRLRAIRERHLVVMVARGSRVKQWREGSDAFFISATAPLHQEQSKLSATVEFPAESWETGRQVPLGGLLPPGDYLLEWLGSWDGPLFQRACEAVQSLPSDRAYMTALAVVYSTLGEPFLEDGSLRPRMRGTPLPRFITFPGIGRAVWAAAERETLRTRDGSAQAVLWRLLAEAFVEVVRELRIDLSKPNLSDKIRVPRPKEGRHWGSWLPPDQWNRVRLQSVIVSRVQRRVREKLLPGSRYQKRSYATHRKLTAAWLPLSPSQRRHLLREMRKRLDSLNYLLFRACLRGLKMTTVGERCALRKSALSERLRSTVCPTFFRVLDTLRPS